MKETRTLKLSSAPTHVCTPAFLDGLLGALAQQLAAERRSIAANFVYPTLF